MSKICGTNLQFTYTVYSHFRTGQAGLGFSQGTRNIFCKCFPGETSCNGRTGTGCSPVCCNPCHHLRFRRFPGLSRVTNRCAGSTCRCSVPCAVCVSSGLLSDMGLASSPQSGTDATELCSGPEAETTVASLLQHSHRDSCSLAVPSGTDSQSPCRRTGQAGSSVREGTGHPWPLPGQ